MSWGFRSIPVAPHCATVLAAVACLGVPTAHAGSITTSSVANFVEPGAKYLPLASNLPFKLFSASLGDSVGGFVGGVGAEASGHVSLGLEALVETIWLPEYSFAYKTANATTASWSGSNLFVGDSFYLTGSSTSLGLTKLNLTDPGIWANLILRESLHLALGAEACLGGCVKVGFTVDVEQGQKLATLNQAGAGDLRVLGLKVSDVLPYTYTTPGKEVAIEAALPNFSKTITSLAPGGQVEYASAQKLAAVNVDVTRILANIVGLPIPLSDSVLGFEYTLLEALVGVGVDLRHEFDLDIANLYTGYVFSSPVQVKEGGGWSAPTTSVSVLAGETVELRTAQPTKTLGIIPSYGLGTHIESTLDVVPYAAASVRALELSGHGLHFGPVINEGTTAPLAHLEVAASSLNRSFWVDGKPLALMFEPLTADSDGIPIDLCASESCLSTAFVPLESGEGDGWRSDRIVRVIDPTSECLLADPEDCVIDQEFAQRPVSYRESGRAGELEFALDPAELARLLALADLIGGAESDEGQLRDALRRLGFDLDNLFLPRRIGDGASFGPIAEDAVATFAFSSVPEPGSIGLLGAALAATLLVRRRRR